MRQAPFSVTMLLFAIYLAALVVGCVVAWILGFFGLPAWFALTLTGFISFVLVGIIRPKIAEFFAHTEGVKGSAPNAFSLPIRYFIGLVTALVLSFLLTLNGGGIGFGVIQGGLISLLTVMIVAVIFMFVVARD